MARYRLRRRAPKRRYANPVRSRLVRRRRMMRRGQPVHHFKRTLYLENNIQATSSVATSTSFGFTLNMLPNVTDFTNLFDMYCIKKVVWKLIPRFSQFNGVYSNPNDLLAQVHTCIDYDDALPLPTTTGLSAITQYESHRVTRGNRVHTRSVVPKLEIDAGASYSLPKAYQWVDCDNVTALHNGIKLFIPQLPGTGNTLSYDTQMVVYFKCKNVV